MKYSKLLCGSALVLTLSLVAGPQQAAAQWQRVTGDINWVQIRPRCNNLVLGVAGASQNNGAAVVQWGANGSNDQLWDFKHIGNGWYKIVNRNSGKVLDVAGYSTSNGAPVHQWAYHGQLNQLWYVESRIEHVPNYGPLRVYRFMNGQSLFAGQGAKYLDVPDSSNQWGVQMIQWEWNGGSNQKFWLP